MPIKLFDTEAERQYEEEVEKYRDRSEKLMEQGKPWPADMRFPQRPEPLADSQDYGTDERPSHHGFADPCGPMNGAVPQTDCVDLDGTSQQNLAGFDSRWNFGRDNDNKPFSNLKKK